MQMNAGSTEPDDEDRAEVAIVEQSNENDDTLQSRTQVGSAFEDTFYTKYSVGFLN